MAARKGTAVRLVVDLDGVRHQHELAGHTPQATLADLVAEVTGSRPGPGEHLWVDDSMHRAGTLLDDVQLMEGTTVSRAAVTPAVELSGWTARVADGLSAGQVVVIPRNRALTIGRAPTADLIIDSPSASWAHATVAFETRAEPPGEEPGSHRSLHGLHGAHGSRHGDQEQEETGKGREPEAEQVEGLRIVDLGSTNGTLVDGRPIGSPEDSGGNSGREDAPAQDDSVQDDSQGSEGDEEHGAHPGGHLLPLLGRHRGEDQEEEPAEEGVFVTEDCVLLVGGAAVVLSRDLGETPAPRPGSLHNVTGQGTVPFNRPPRPGQPPRPVPLNPPSRRSITEATKFSIISVLAPLVLAVVMVLMLHDMRYAMFSALSPILGVGTWLEQKRRYRADTRAEEERFGRAMETFRGDLRDAAAAERRRREALVPDPAVVMRWAERPTTRLWERRTGTDGFLDLHVGVGDAPWTPPVDERHSGQRPEKEVSTSWTTATSSPPRSRPTSPTPG
jgi:hypothetical protein